MRGAESFPRSKALLKLTKVLYANEARDEQMPARAMMKHGLRLNLIKHLQFARGCMVILHHSGLLGYFKNLFRLLLAVLAD